MPKLAINGGPKVRGDKAFPSWPVFDHTERRALKDVLESGKWWYGEKVAEFERAYADYQDAQFGITTTNGTAALYIALLACGIGAGDEMIVPPYTFMATASAVLQANAIPVFADVELDTFNIDPSAVEAAITPKTKGILPVHFGGLPADMDAIRQIAKEHHLVVIEDACHAWGSEWNGVKVGALGDMGCFSFQMSKNITAGEGGIVLTNQEELADRARSFSNCGRLKEGAWYAHYLLGGNFRMTEMQAALLLCQLARLDDQVTVRERNGQFLDAELGKLPGIRPLRRDPRVNRRSWHLYSFLYEADALKGLPRARFVEALQAEGLHVSTCYPVPLYKHELFTNQGEGPGFCPISCPYYGKPMDYTKVHCANAEEICKTMVMFFQHDLLGTQEDMQDIVDAVKKVSAHADELL